VDIKIIAGNLRNAATEVIVVPHYEGRESLQPVTRQVDTALGGVIRSLIEKGEIKGKFKELNLIYSLGKLPAVKVLVLGLGKKSELNNEKIRVAAAETVKFLRLKNTPNLAVTPFGAGEPGLSAEAIGQSIVEGALLGEYSFRRHITKAPENPAIKELHILAEKNLVQGLRKGAEKGRILAESAGLARDLVNEPSNILTPGRLADLAGDQARLNRLEIQVLEREEMQNLKMGGLLSVAQGSQQPPKFIVLTHRGRRSRDIDIALVGKGITFDSGGISIKPSESMGDMKGDMAGGAAVIGAVVALAQLKARVNVTAIVPATENLPSGTAFKPGDIITIMNGKTVEIVTTDAEGRLILADAISYALKMEARNVVDVATLTGACHIALGDVCTGAFGNDQSLMDRLLKAGQATGECMWQMPMNEEYRELNKSDVADLKNSGGRYGGAISAAWFLREFADKTAWIHLDIAGTSDISKERGYLVKGATGVPVRTLVELVLTLRSA
jgi:leucyl aminopeptidase